MVIRLVEESKRIHGNAKASGKRRPLRQRINFTTDLCAQVVIIPLRKYYHPAAAIYSIVFAEKLNLPSWNGEIPRITYVLKTSSSRANIDGRNFDVNFNKNTGFPVYCSKRLEHRFILFFFFFARRQSSSYASPYENIAIVTFIL